MSEKSTIQALNLVCTIGKAFLEASALLDSDDLSNPELAQIVERIGQIYGQGESIKSPEQGEDSSTQADEQDAHTDLPEQTSLPQIMIPKKTHLQALKSLQYFEALRNFPLGTEIPDTWQDEFGHIYDNPLIVMQYRKQLCDDGKEHFGVELARKYVLPREISFSTTDSNLYSASEINRWLNTTINGYMDGCTDELCDILCNQPKVRLIASIMEKWGKPVRDVCDCYAYLPSGANLFRDWGIDPCQVIDGELWACFRNVKPIFYDNLKHACDCWLRSTCYDTVNAVWSTNNAYLSENTNLLFQRKCAPICHFILL